MVSLYDIDQIDAAAPLSIQVDSGRLLLYLDEAKAIDAKITAIHTGVLDSAGVSRTAYSWTQQQPMPGGTFADDDGLMAGYDLSDTPPTWPAFCATDGAVAVDDVVRLYPGKRDERTDLTVNYGIDWWFNPIVRSASGSNWTLINTYTGTATSTIGGSGTLVSTGFLPVGNYYIIGKVLIGHKPFINSPGTASDSIGFSHNGAEPVPVPGLYEANIYCEAIVTASVVGSIYSCYTIATYFPASTGFDVVYVLSYQSGFFVQAGISWELELWKLP